MYEQSSIVKYYLKQLLPKIVMICANEIEILFIKSNRIGAVRARFCHLYSN